MSYKQHGASVLTEQESNTVVRWTGKTTPAKHTPTAEEIAQVRQNMQTMHVEEAMEFILPMIFSYCAQAGFVFADPDDDQYDPSTDVFFKDGTFVAEALRSLLLKYYEIKHPIQLIADGFVEVTPDGGYTIATRVETTSYRVAANGMMMDTVGNPIDTTI